MEQPITFFSKGLEKYEQRYSFVEKQVLSVIKSLKKFRHLLTYNKVILRVTHPSVKEFLLSKDLNEKRAGWITRVMEYDVDIQITKLVRGKGLCEQIADKDISELEEQANAVLLIGAAGNNDGATSWLKDMVHFLKTSQCPATLDRAKRRYYRLQSVPFVIINDILYRKDFNGVLLRCIDSDQMAQILNEFHDGHSGGHFSPRTTAYKIL